MSVTLAEGYVGMHIYNAGKEATHSNKPRRRPCIERELTAGGDRGGRLEAQVTLTSPIVQYHHTDTQSQRIHRCLGGADGAAPFLLASFSAAHKQAKKKETSRCCSRSGCLCRHPPTHLPHLTHYTDEHRTRSSSPCQARGERAPTARASRKKCSTPFPSPMSQPGSGWPKWCSPGAATSCRYVGAEGMDGTRHLCCVWLWVSWVCNLGL